MSQRSKFSLYYARNIWEETGEIINYITPEGVEKAFEPSLEEIDKKIEIKRSKSLISWILFGLKNAYIYWSIIGIASIVIGFFILVRKRGFN